MDKEQKQHIEELLNYSFKDEKLLERAFTHSSSVSDRTLSNERLEFLGDAVLGVVICQELFELFPGHCEGDLTKMKSMLVSRGTCSRIIKDSGLEQYLKLGKGMANTRGLPRSLLAGLLEAIIAAVYIDGGFDPAQKMILELFSTLIDKTDPHKSQGNYKSMLQQYAQEQYHMTPAYILLDEKGPDHNKCFEVEVILNNRHFPSAWGANKKEAEQRAAYKALETIGLITSKKTCSES